MKKFLVFGALLTSIAYAKGPELKDGRFQVTQLSDRVRDQILIDTETGALWRYTCSAEKPDLCFWTPELVIGINTTMDKIQKATQSGK